MDDEPKPHTRVIQLSSWEEFLKYIADFENAPRKPWDEIWFRGQSKATWALHTTLGNGAGTRHAVADYLRLIGEIQPAIETFTGGQFSIPDRMGIENFCREYDLFDQKLRGLATYLAHLRHGGFPSPPLDWSVSPYVAAYFAFHHAELDGDVAMYAYREWAGGMKVGGSDDPHIMSLGPLFKTHKRHFRQHSRYTACVQFEAGEAVLQASTSRVRAER